MELSASLTPFLYLTGAFLDPTNFKPLQRLLNQREIDVKTLDASQHQYDAAIISNDYNWQVDGCTGRGVQYFARPYLHSGKLHPRTIDIFIPDQAIQPVLLRRLLQSTLAFYTSTSTSKSLPICRYIAQSLKIWSSSINGFHEMYENIPFGSRIVFETMTYSPGDNRIRVFPVDRIEESLLSCEDLCTMWSLSLAELPPILHLDELELKMQITSSVSTVTVSSRSGERIWAYKSNLKHSKYMYHELKSLMNKDQHPNVMSGPEYLVTGPQGTPSSRKVYGFIMEYYPLGNLGHLIERKKGDNSLTLELKLDWSIQIVSALEWFLSSPAKYFSGLKPDNIMCITEETLKIIDLEQAGNWATFTAPEIQYVNQLSWLLQTPYVPEKTKEEYSRRLKLHLPSEKESSATYDNPEDGYFESWNELGPKERESAMVFAVGMLLWCIFENCTHLRNFCDEDWDEACAWEFPAFRQTSEKLQRLIRDSTRGSPLYHIDHRTGLTRVGDKVYPRNQTGKNGEKEASVEETVDFAKNHWRQELHQMETYLGAKERWHAGSACSDDLELLGFTKRPDLATVKHIICQERLWLATHNS